MNRETHKVNHLLKNRILTPFQEFFKLESASGILLFISAVIAVIWANSIWATLYQNIFHSSLNVGIGQYQVSTSVMHLINDGLMAIFFLVVGLEIKREMLVGELASPKKALLPIFAALGGMLFPATIYWLMTSGTEGVRGWGIPMATDIAFAIGMLAILGNKVPLGLKVMLTALAIIDDIGAVLVIAVFYTNEISLMFLGLAGITVVILAILNWSNVRSVPVYLVFGVILWYLVLQSGIHSTIAGVILAMCIPATTRVNQKEFIFEGHRSLDDFSNGSNVQAHAFLNHKQINAIYSLMKLTKSVQSPLQFLDTGLHKVVTFLIMPVFALANAGVVIGDQFGSLLSDTVATGTAFGLVFGKAIGIFLFSFLAVKLKLAVLPSSVRWMHVLGIGLLGGIGFTMSLFIANLAFPSGSHLDAAKIGIIGGSLVSAILGWIVLMLVSSTRRSISTK